MPHPSSCAVGIDVAKASLSVCLLFPGGKTTALSIRNTEADITHKLIPQLTGRAGTIVMEATSYYHWLAALLLSQQGFDVRVINPLLAKKYTHASVRQVKSDPADAVGLAHCALLEPKLPAAFRAVKQQLALRKKLGFMASLSHQLQAMRASLASLVEAKEICSASLSPAEQSVQQTTAALAKQLKQLEKEVIDSLAREKKLALTQLTTIPGVSPLTAALALHLLTEPTQATAKSWIAYAGFDVSVRESGTWHGQCRLTKRGHPYLRRRLYGAAWGAVMNHDSWRQYYDHLRAGDRQHTEALTIIARKLIRIMHALVKQSTQFDPTRPLLVGQAVDK